MKILIGPIIHYVVEVDSLPKDGDEIKLKPGISLLGGKYRLSRQGEITYKGVEYPFFVKQASEDKPGDEEMVALDATILYEENVQEDPYKRGISPAYLDLVHPEAGSATSS